MNDLTVLQAVRLKGRINVSDLAETLREDPTDVTEASTRLSSHGLLIPGPPMRLTPAGRTHLAELLDAERTILNAGALSAIYADFRGLNTELKAALTDWQLRDGNPNAHDDPAYDAAVLARVEEIHDSAAAVLAAAATALPRLANYRIKLDAALEHIRQGETSWLTKPLIDSYHTVWFELHEELISATGLTREQEARDGHAS